ncbi:hypothetical protein HanRHA438_Chr08g0360291 [Helianthus annuus]|nr:hypothetical protein HanRHA438_Chr08g0360291 [Helianthus annuus]
MIFMLVHSSLLAHFFVSCTARFWIGILFQVHESWKLDSMVPAAKRKHSTSSSCS